MAANQAAVEQQIREALNTATDATMLSDQLFSPHGLFNQIATTEAERREIVRSDLFQDAQKHLSDLQRKEADEFARKVRDLPELAEPRRLLKLERS